MTAADNTADDLASRLVTRFRAQDRAQCHKMAANSFSQLVSPPCTVSRALLHERR